MNRICDGAGVLKLGLWSNGKVAGWNLAGLCILPGTIGFICVKVAQGATGDGWHWTIPVIFALASLIALNIEEKVLKVRDKALLPIAIFLCGISLFEIYRLRPDLIWRQLSWISLGLAVFFIVASVVRDYTWLQQYRYVIGVAACILLALGPLFGREIGGAKSWVQLFGVSLEPSEPAKPLMVIFLAGYLTEARRLLSAPTRRIMGVLVPEIGYVGPMFLIWGISLLLLMFQRDLGTALLLFAVYLSMLYLASGRSSYLVLGLFLIACGGVLSYLLFGHVRNRVLIWLNPWRDPKGAGYQMIQSLYAIAAGGVTGVGPGAGLPRAIPAVETDFIFSALLEEFGIIVGAPVLMAYFYLAAEGIGRAMSSSDEFGALLAGGISVLFSLQTLIILGGVFRIIPMTGVTTPFISYGGSSMVTCFGALGILARIGGVGSGAVEQAGYDRPAIQKACRRFLGFTAGGLAIVAAVMAYYAGAGFRYLAADPQNPRMARAEERIIRGSILARRGEILAFSEVIGDKSIRRYSVPESLAQVIGYSHSRYGKSGIEAAYNKELLGLDDFLIQPPRRGKDVLLTIDLGLQKLGERLLRGRPGAIVAIFPATGDILACVSEPGFDPCRLDETWYELASDPGRALLNRATQGLYPPGSALKPIIAIAALDAGKIRADDTFECNGSIMIDGQVISCPGPGGNGNGHGKVTLDMALARSCNVAFVEIAEICGEATLKEAMKAWGFHMKPTLEIPASAPRFPLEKAMSRSLIAESGIGQGETLVTPLFMAQVAAAISMGGMMPEPRIIMDIVQHGRRPGSAAKIGPHFRRVSSITATRVIRDMMVDVVSKGTGRLAAIPGIEVAGKTGTAQNPAGPPHAWFIGFAPASDPQIAVSVVVENGGSGGLVAAPIARELMKYWLEQVGILEKS